MITNALPASWRLTTLGEVAAPVPNAIVDGPFGSNLKLSDYIEEGVPVLQGKNITNDSFRWFDVRFISEQKAHELKRSSIRVGDILLVKIGSIGYSAVVNYLNGFDFAIIPANLAKVTPDPKVIDIGYLHKWITSVDAKRYFVGAASKTAQPALSLGKIKSLPLPLPPLPEQRRIAEVLDQAEALRTKRRAALAQIDILTQAIFLDLFGDPTTNPRKWPKNFLRELVMEFRYGTSNKSQTHGKPALRIPNVVGGAINVSDLKLVPVDAAEFQRLKLTDGDVLFVRTNGNPEFVGRCAVFDRAIAATSGFPDDEFVFASYLIRARLRTDAISPIFLREFMLGTEGRKELRARSKTSAGQFNINTENLGAIPVIVPPLQLQRDFARRIAAIEKLKAAHRASLAELDALFAALQHRAFRGEL